MKTFKITRKVQIILATLFVIVTGVIIVGIVSNNGTMATTTTIITCDICGENMEIVDYDANNHY